MMYKFDMCKNFQDTLLEVSEKLRDRTVSKDPATDLDDSTTYKVAVDDLEDLMHGLSDLFEKFPPQRPANTTTFETPKLKRAPLSQKPTVNNRRGTLVDLSSQLAGSPGRVMKIVTEINRILSKDTKENKI